MDPEWPKAMQNAIAKLWEMYEYVNNAKLEQAIKHADAIYKLTEEKKQLEKTCTSLVADVNKCINQTSKRIIADKYQVHEGRILEKIFQTIFLPSCKKLSVGHLCEVEQEKDKLANELEQLKIAVEYEKDNSFWQEAIWSEERDHLTKEKEMLEYKIADLLKEGDKNKAKLKSIKSLCDE